MRPLKRVTRQVDGHSNLLLSAAIQVHHATIAEELEPKMAEQLMYILQRMHTKLLIDSGVYDRKRMARYKLRQKQLAHKRRDYRARAANLVMYGCVLIAFVHIAVDTWL